MVAGTNHGCCGTRNLVPLASNRVYVIWNATCQAGMLAHFEAEHAVLSAEIRCSFAGRCLPDMAYAFQRGAVALPGSMSVTKLLIKLTGSNDC
jgi:hypothetical protein